MGFARLLIAVGAGLALADASIVTLALPEILIELDATVEGVAAVIGAYTVVLAVALPVAALLRRILGGRIVGLAGFALFGAASYMCADVSQLDALLQWRVIQALGGALALVAAFAAIGGGRLWSAAAVLGTAAGPALGGALTQAFDWRAIFMVQVPLAALAALAILLSRRTAATEAPRSVDDAAVSGLDDVDADASGAMLGKPGAVIALAALSAALTGVLFLLVLLLIAGWAVEPLAAAAAVSVLPVAALVGARVPGPAAVRACVGCVLVAGGVAALAVLPQATLAWIVLPQVLAGIGMGMGLPALAGDLLAERTPAQAAWLLAARHIGITLALVLIAPVVGDRLERTIDNVQLKGVAIMLDARLPPRDKIEVAGPLLADVDPVSPRTALRRAFAQQADRFADEPRYAREYKRVAKQADDTLIDAVDDSFNPAFLIAAALALLGAVVVLPRPGRQSALSARGVRRAGVIGGAVAGIALAAALPAGYSYLRGSLRPTEIVIADPCKPRRLPSTGGFEGALQDRALTTLDKIACRYGSSREELALGLADARSARAYERRYGIDPRSINLVMAALGFDTNIDLPGLPKIKIPGFGRP